MIRLFGSVVAAAVLTASAQAVENPFTEMFGSDNSGWRDSNAANPLGWVAGGSYNGSSYATGGFNFVNSVVDDTPVIFRGQDEFNFSNGAFEGDWIADGVTEFMAFVRHDAPVSLTFFARFSGPDNFPGATAISFIPVAPNMWTPIIIEVTPTSPNFISFEGTDFETVFSANPVNNFQGIGHIQIGVSVPDTLAGLDQSFTFDVDDISVAPTPATIIALGGLVALRRRRR